MELTVVFWSNKCVIALLPKIDLYKHPSGLGVNIAFLIWNISIYHDDTGTESL